MRWESLISLYNLRLAWRRINTGRNLQHKRFFRELYLVYETALEDNLRALRVQLQNGAWVPTHPHRLYIAKPSGLQRPVSLLGIEDQILLQAVANIFSRKVMRRRRLVELTAVFSNILSDEADSIFFTRSWRETYNAFQARCAARFIEGNRWIAHFDLAAYYDTISHDVLLQIPSPRGAHAETRGKVREWLRVWSSPHQTAVTSHGIPQGPIASDFLAEAFFLPIDIALHKKGIKYVRYADDIRIFGSTENEARHAGIALERLCRDLGLIPQGKKFALAPAQTAREALGNLPSIPPPGEGEETEPMAESEAIELLKSCIGGRPLRVKDKSRFRYLMYRAPKSSRVLGTVLRLLPRHPEYIDDFVAFFANYRGSKRIVNGAIKTLYAGLPYAYARGELWHLLARLATREQLTSCLAMARQDARGRKECLGLSWGVMNFLIRCQEEGLCRTCARLKAEAPLSRALLASRLPEAEFGSNRVGTAMLRGTVEEQLAAARQLQARGYSLASVGLRQRDLPAVAQHSLRSLGVIRRVSKGPRDWIAERLHRRYGGSQHTIWRSLLSTEYEHALQILIESDATYDAAPSHWLQLQDSFDDIVVRQFIRHLRERGLPGGTQATVASDGRLVSYGVLVKAGGPMELAFPNLVPRLRSVHARRNRLPGSHPYDQKGGAQNTWLARHERDTLCVDAGLALDEIADCVSSNP